MSLINDLPVTLGDHGATESPSADLRRDAGPLLAVFGTSGGAGASTLAYLVACDRAPSGGGPVLLCDTGGPTAALALYARTESPRSMPDAAGAIARGEALEHGLYVETENGLRVIARRGARPSVADPLAVATMLRDARRAHAMTVVDCGSGLGAVEQAVLEAATHVAWVLPATSGGVARARGFLELIDGGQGAAEIVVARRAGTERRGLLRELKLLASERQAPLVLLPSVTDLCEQPPEQALADAALTLAALRGVLLAS